jgi:hypothetical protein
MESNPDQRDTSRFGHEAAIMFENYASGRYYEGRMYNYSRGGMYFESDFAPKVGTEIFIGVENSPHTSGHDVYRAKVIWKKELTDSQSFFLYGVGVKYF